MSFKLSSQSSKTSSCRCTTATRASSVKSTKPRVANPRRVIASKQLAQNTDRKACSVDTLQYNKNGKPKKTTKSDFSVSKKKDQNHRCTHLAWVPIFDCRRTCGDIGDARSVNPKQTSSDTKSAPTTVSLDKTTKKSNGNDKQRRKMPKSVQQYYKNENYRAVESADDISNGLKKISLDTIKEVSEKYPSDSLIKIFPDDSEEDITFLDTDDHETLRQLKEFRQQNYFECHSAKSRIRNKPSPTSLQGHKCVYRFYLNERLFPVPLSTDHNNQVRCVECHLPMELNVKDTTKINGTIQAKVTIGKQNQDVMLLLPVKEPLIITEKRKEEKRNDNEVVFFGVINLDGFGNSVFNPTLPENSFALKYQKGYKEFEYIRDYSYRDIDKNDVIVI